MSRRQLLIFWPATVAVVVAILGYLVLTRSTRLTPPSSSTGAPSVSGSSGSSGGSALSGGSGSSGGFPSAASTGWQHTGVSLSPYTGPLTITVDGTVIDGKDVRGCLQINANNVTISNSRVSCAGSSPDDPGNMVVQQSTSRAPDVSGLQVVDTEITRPAGSNGGADYGLLIYGMNVTLTRVNIHNVTSGVHFSSNGPVTIEESYIAGLVNISGQDHIDGVIANGGTANVTLRHNTIEVPDVQTTPIAIFPEGTPNSYWVVDRNLIAGGGYCIYPSYTKGHDQPNHHISIINNVFGTQFYPRCGSVGPVDGGVNGANFLDGIGNTWSGNTWSNTGAPITP